MDKHLTEQITQKTSDTTELTKNSIPAPDTGSDIAQSFEGLPIENLITAPIIAAVKGQQELSSVYIDNLLSLAYSDEADKETNKKRQWKSIILKHHYYH